MKNFYKYILILILTLSIPSIVYSSDLKNHYEKCNVEKVVDGDTVFVNTGYESFPIRLYGIDCMEISKSHRAYHQAYDSQI